MAKRIITETEVFKASASDTKTITFSHRDSIVTPQAWDKALELGVAIVEEKAARDEARQQKSTGAGYVPGQDEAVVSEVLASMRNRLPAGELPADLEQLVREAVQVRLNTASDSSQGPSAGGTVDSASKGPRGVHLVRKSLLAQAGGSPKPVTGKVTLAESLGNFGQAGDQHLSAGTMEWENSSFKRTLESEEVCVVIEGELCLTTQGQPLTAQPGDMFYLPKGAQVVYSASGKVKLACVNSLP